MNHPSRSQARRPAPGRRQRRGAITVLLAFLIVVFIATVAFSVDLGYLMNGQEQLQRSADAAALAAAWNMVDQTIHGASQQAAVASSRTTAETYAGLNTVLGRPPVIDTNTGNSPDGDVVFGYLTDLNNPQSFTTSGSGLYNAVRVRVRRHDSMNGRIPFFFGRVFGLTGTPTEAHGTAALVKSIRGFQTPSNGGNLDILPFALDQQTWSAWVAGAGTDVWSYNASTGAVTAGADGKKEVNLYPQGTGSPGNRGTVDIGKSNNSTADISRQILTGISPSDMAAIGGKLEFDSHNELHLNGDTGISAGVKDELASIIGKPRAIPVFSTVVGPGNNADYTIVKWIGIRIMSVKLTGGSKSVMVQEAPLVMRGVIPSTTTSFSESIYSPAYLYQ